jgi:hypothetical protein
MEMYLGIAVFVVLFFAWVVVPPIIRKRHAMPVEEEITD